MSPRFRLPFAAVVAALLLGACGFHLAGTRPLPEALQHVNVDVITPYRVSEPPVESALRAGLLRRGATLAEEARAGVTQIVLSELDESRQVLSIGPDGKALEFRLVTRVRYEVRRDNVVLIPPGTLLATRDYSFEPEQVLAKEAEEARLREFIQAELAELLMLRLEAQLSRLPSTTSAAPTVVPAAEPGAAPAP